VRDHRVESGRVVALMEPSELGLLLGAETRHSLHEDMRGRHGSQTAGLLLTLLRARDHDTDQSTCPGGHTTATKRPQWVGLWSSDTIVAPRPAPSLHTQPMRAATPAPAEAQRAPDDGPDAPVSLPLCGTLWTPYAAELSWRGSPITAAVLRSWNAA
jgi:hypothetical protein